MKRLFLTLMIAGASTTGFSQTYLCIAEAAGGVTWNGQKWEGAEFKANGKYLIKSVKESGDAVKIGWVRFGGEYPMSICEWSDSRQFLICEGFYEVRFNKNTNRFVSHYMAGYIGGRDDKKDTPSVEVGTCARIDGKD